MTARRTDMPCEVDGCLRLTHSGSRYCSGHAKQFQLLGKTTGALREHLSLRERVMKLVNDLADADSEDDGEDGEYERAWDSLEHALTEWGDATRARRGGKARAKILSPERRKAISRIGWTAWFTSLTPEQRQEQSRRAGEARVRAQSAARRREIARLGNAAMRAKAANPLTSKRASRTGEQQHKGKRRMRKRP